MLWGIWSTPSLWLLPGPLWAGGIGPTKIPSMGIIEIFIISYTWNHLTVWKQTNNVE